MILNDEWSAEDRLFLEKTSKNWFECELNSGPT